MNIFEVIRKRRSFRKYTKDRVEWDKINKILDAARMAPSAANRQPWRFLVLTEPAVKERLRPSYDKDWFIEAPVIIVACAVPGESWCRMDGEAYWKVDVAIAMQNLVLVSTELGLGTCWIGAFNEGAARKALLIPEDVRVLAMTPLGYPAEDKGLVSNRKPIGEIAYLNQWGRSCQNINVPSLPT